MKLKDKIVKTKSKAISVAEDVKEGIIDTVKENPGAVIIGAVWLAVIATSGIHIARCMRENKAFMASVKSVFGPNVDEGCVYGGDPRKLWGMRNNWEEVGKSNFDKLKEVAKTMELQLGESLSVEKIGYGKHKGQVELFQMLDNGFFHNEYI